MSKTHLISFTDSREPLTASFFYSPQSSGILINRITSTLDYSQSLDEQEAINQTRKQNVDVFHYRLQPGQRAGFSVIQLHQSTRSNMTTEQLPANSNSETGRLTFTNPKSQLSSIHLTFGPGVSLKALGFHIFPTGPLYLLIILL